MGIKIDELTEEKVVEIIKKGSERDRLILLLEDKASQKIKQKSLFDYFLFLSILSSLEDDGVEDYKVENLFTRERSLFIALLNLQGLLYEVKMRYSDIRAYILTWFTIESAEEMVNMVLHEIKDPAERKKISKPTAKETEFLRSSVKADEEGYIEIDIENTKEEGKPLRELISLVKSQTIQSAVKWLSYEKAILDYMKKYDLDSAIYKDYLKELKEDFISPSTAWTKYSSSENKFTDDPHMALNKLKSKYSIIPDFRKLEINQDDYNYFTKHILHDATKKT